jgi:hypothetical protein
MKFIYLFFYEILIIAMGLCAEKTAQDLSIGR